ncbi:MAG: hypothetical protein HYZ59_08335 [Actinobacteria bacterium]|nr:hypothetical protein [Actinomycetota bacterium]
MSDIAVAAISSPSGRISPTPQEAAAIVAAVEEAWPRAVAVEAPTGADLGASWRFSGRWWAKPIASRRDRPW